MPKKRYWGALVLGIGLASAGSWGGGLAGEWFYRKWSEVGPTAEIVFVAILVVIPSLCGWLLTLGLVWLFFIQKKPVGKDVMNALLVILINLVSLFGFSFFAGAPIWSTDAWSVPVVLVLCGPVLWVVQDMALRTLGAYRS